MMGMRQRRGTEITISGVIPSLVLSLLASAAATFLLRRLLSTESGAVGTNQDTGQGRPTSGNVSVAVPVVVLTIVSGNRWVIGRRRRMPRPFFLPFLLARVLRKRQQRRQKQSGWQRWRQ